VRPDTDEVDAPRLQGIQILIARGGRTQRVEQADAHDELRVPIQLKGLGVDRESRARRRCDERNQRERANRDGDAYSGPIRPGTR
jgi:hypothetical protein